MDSKELLNKYKELTKHEPTGRELINFTEQYLPSSNQHYQRSIYNVKEQLYTFGNSFSGDVKHLYNLVTDYVNDYINGKE